jgi:hypothetical protein
LTVVLRPPTKVASTDDVVKSEADENPGYVVERRRGRQVVRASEDKREIQVLEGLYVEFLVEYPLNNWRKDPDQEEKDETVIELAMGEQTLWSDDTPLHYAKR